VGAGERREIMQLRRSSIGRGSLLATALSLVLAACGGGGDTTGQAASPTPATKAATSPTTSADPLEGDWRTEFTCQDSLRAIRSRLSEEEILEQVGSWKEFMGGWGGEPTDDDPCNEAAGTHAFVARFADGNLALCDATTGGCDVHATYELVSDHSISLNDPEGNLCEGTKPPTGCPVTWKFDISGEELTFHLPPDAFTIGLWEAASWTRES
jgi:hypothetical protein